MPLLLQKQIEIKNVQLGDNTEGQQVGSQSPAKASKSKKAKEEKVWLTALNTLYIRLHLLHPGHPNCSVAFWHLLPMCTCKTSPAKITKAQVCASHLLCTTSVVWVHVAAPIIWPMTIQGSAWARLM